MYCIHYTCTMCIAHLWRNGDEFFIAPVQKQKRFWSTGFYISKKRLRKMDRVGREFCGNASRRVCKHFTLRRRLMAARSSCQQHWQFHPLLWQVGRSPPYLSILVEAPEAKTIAYGQGHSLRWPNFVRKRQRADEVLQCTKDGGAMGYDRGSPWHSALQWWWVWCSFTLDFFDLLRGDNLSAPSLPSLYTRHEATESRQLGGHWRETRWRSRTKQDTHSIGCVGAYTINIYIAQNVM